MDKYLPILIGALWAFGFFAAVLAVSCLVRPSRKRQPRRDSTENEPAALGFSSGETVAEKPWIRMAARDQALAAVAAVVFIAVLVLVPAAASYRRWLEEGRGWLGFGAVGAFLGILAVSLMFALAKGDLSWARDVEKRPDGTS